MLFVVRCFSKYGVCCVLFVVCCLLFVDFVVGRCLVVSVLLSVGCRVLVVVCCLFFLWFVV